jgi:hypothetical protein
MIYLHILVSTLSTLLIVKLQSQWSMISTTEHRGSDLQTKIAIYL